MDPAELTNLLDRDPAFSQVWVAAQVQIQQTQGQRNSSWHKNSK